MSKGIPVGNTVGGRVMYAVEYRDSGGFWYTVPMPALHETQAAAEKRAAKHPAKVTRIVEVTETRRVVGGNMCPHLPDGATTCLDWTRPVTPEDAQAMHCVTHGSRVPLGAPSKPLPLTESEREWAKSVAKRF